MDIKRSILPKIIESLEEPEITVLVGARQVGKTYITRLLQKHLEKMSFKSLYINLDIQKDREILSSQENFISYLNLFFGKEKGYVFIDEVQRLENTGLFLKGIYDSGINHKLVVLGSGSLDIKARIKESLAGRKRVFTITGISFQEFISFKTDYKYDKPHDLFTINPLKVNPILNEYLKYGGYPKVVLADSTEEKTAQLNEILGSYIEKDINGLLKVEKSDILVNLLTLLASQIGSIVNVSELSNTLGVSGKTIERYLYYLEETYIIKRVRPYFTNIRSEIVKSPVYYFLDLGLRNILLNLTGIAPIPLSLSGHLFENLILNMISNTIIGTSSRINFWRSKDGAEVDFVINRGSSIVPVEVKLKKMDKIILSKSMLSFIKRYSPKTFYILHTGTKKDEMMTGNSKINLMNFANFELTD